MTKRPQDTSEWREVYAVDICCYLGEPRRPLWLWQSQEDDA